jgi:hypothetical protein
MGHFRWVFRALAIGAITGWLAVLIVRGAGWPVGYRTVLTFTLIERVLIRAFHPHMIVGWRSNSVSNKAAHLRSRTNKRQMLDEVYRH